MAEDIAALHSEIAQLKQGSVGDNDLIKDMIKQHNARLLKHEKLVNSLQNQIDKLTARNKN